MEAYAQQKTARTWDSFAPALKKVLNVFKPAKIFEWGPGVSTRIMETFGSVEIIHTAEHDEAWFCKWKNFGFKKALIAHFHNLDEYVQAITGQKLEYDLIFVDGAERARCLDIAHNHLNHTGIVMLHDAERAQYRDAINRYSHVIFVDDGNTAVMTNNPVVAAQLERCLGV